MGLSLFLPVPSSSELLLSTTGGHVPAQVVLSVGAFLSSLG